MEMHTVLLHPWNTNSETNRSMHKGLRLERCRRVKERKRTIMSTAG
jgi:hypothetical protein